MEHSNERLKTIFREGLKQRLSVVASAGSIGGFGANHHLRQSLVFVDVPAMQQPKAYIGGAANLFDAEGKISNESTREFLRKFME